MKTTEHILQQHDLIYVSSSNQGSRKDMEDVYTVETNIPSFPEYSFYGVYDGHNGKMTAKYLGEKLHLNIFKKIQELGENNIEKAIKDAFMQTDSDLKNEHPDCDSGSTAIVAVITPSKIVYVGNAGDSRAVMSVAGLAIPLSEDHKPRNDNERQRIEQAGGYVNEDGRLNARLNFSRSFGDFEFKEISDKKPEEQKVIAYPDVKSYKVDTETDFLILTSDGILNYMSSQEVVDYINEEVQKHKDLSKACEYLMSGCFASWFESCDNMAIVIVGFLHGLEKEQWLKRIGRRYTNKEE